MIRILKLFQIQTIRSAWFFLFGSGILFIFGIYQQHIYTKNTLNSETPFFTFWLFITAIYFLIASWALFSKKGKSYLTLHEKVALKNKKSIFWYFKFLFACYGAAFGTIMLLGVIALPFVGASTMSSMYNSSNTGMYFLVSGLVWSPLIFKYLKWIQINLTSASRTFACRSLGHLKAALSLLF